MPESPLSFNSTNPNRQSLLSRNLAPYSVSGIWSNTITNYNSQVNFTFSNVIDSPNNLVGTKFFSNQNIPRNEYGPNSGSYPNNLFGTIYPVSPNMGEYYPNETNMDLLYEGAIEAAYINNKYGPEDGYDLMYTIDDVQLNNKVYQPYWNPPIFTPSSYSAYQLYINPNAQGTNGPITNDSRLAQIGALQLRDLFQARVDTELLKTSILKTDVVNPYLAFLNVAGGDGATPKNFRITISEDPLSKGFDFIGRISGVYAPASPIPGDYFNESIFGDTVGKKTVSNLGVINRALGGSLGPIMNFFRNPSETFLAYTSNGQKSVLFSNINRNKYKPNYDFGFGGGRGVLQTGVNVLVQALGGGTSSNSNNYLGSRTTDLAQITSPPNQVPVNSSGQQVQAPVYGPDAVAKIFEGNEGRLNFGLAGKTNAEAGSLDGGFVWVSPKYKGNAGFNAKPGGAPGKLDEGYTSLIKSSYELNQSTNLTFRTDSILDNTQRLVDSGDKVQGANRLLHVGNAINQVSKVFNDGYKEITKGSRVLSYVDNVTNNEIITTGREVGVEYCRLFTKDTPYYTIADLQKTDGITTSGRRFTYSVLDNTYNLNIAPLRLPNSTNIKTNNEGKFVAKKYMLSIENLAWRTSSRPGFTYDDLPLCERGPNGGRVMWFPPYDLKFNDSSSAQFQGTSFIGRPEPMYTYKETTRSGSLSFKIVVDHPSVLNTIIRKQLKGQTKERVDSIVNSFFAGCVKYDIYELAKRFNTIPLSDLVRFQMAIENPNTSRETIERVANEIPKENETNVNNVQSETGGGNNSTNNGNQNQTTTEKGKSLESEFINFALYFHNDIPGPQNANVKTTTIDYESTYNTYIGLKQEYINQAKTLFDTTTATFCKKPANSGSCIDNQNVSGFYNEIIIPNYERLKKEFVPKAFEILNKGGTIKIDMVGSASALSDVAYNDSLSSRRIDCVINYLKTQKDQSDSTKTMKQYFDDKKIIITKTLAQGERGTSEPIPGGLKVNCTTDQNGGSGTGADTTNAKIYSWTAMACRRVVVTSIKVEVPNDETKKPDEEPKPNTVTEKNPPDKTIEDEVKLIPRPRPNSARTTAITDGISKKILRNLFSECDYFDALKEESPMMYDTLKDKIKFFNPAFHSMTPEGLNARLVFLNQCVRPGETIPTIGADGRPKFNDAVNTSFGTPPVLILRIGDFYHTKIIPDSVSFTYDPLSLDLNPEGIGLQPMIANVTLGFKIIGGMGLAKPVEELQNALSFSYYANTEIYDERATPTDESYKVLDKEILEALNNGKSNPSTIKPIATNGGGTPIGEITASNTTGLGSISGDINYNKLMDSLLTQTSDYFKVVFSQLESVVVSQNLGFAQIFNFNRNFKFGNLRTIPFDDANTLKIEIYGKPNEWEAKIEQYYNQVLIQIDGNTNPIIKELVEIFPKVDEFPLLDIKIEMKKYVTKIYQEIRSVINTPISEIVKFQQNYIQTIRKINLIIDKTDGVISNQGTAVPYNLSGDAYTTLVNDYKTLKPTIDKFNNLLKTNKISFMENSDSLSLLTDIGDDSEINFFLFMSRILTNPESRNSFVQTIIPPNGDVEVFGKTLLKNKINNTLNKLAKKYKKELEKEKELFDKIKKNGPYVELTSGLDEEMYVKGKTRNFKFTSTPNEDVEDLQKPLIVNLYRTTNANNDTTTFDGKITFN